MGLNDLFHHFDKSEYTARIKSSTDTELQQREVVKTRQRFTASFSGGTYLGMALPTCGASMIMAPLTARKYYIARQKLKIVQAELERRNIPLYETRKRDVAISALTGTIGLAVGMVTLGVTDGLTDSLMFMPLGSSGATEASAIDALSSDPFGAVGDAVRGAAAQFQEVGVNVTGDTIGQTILPEGQMVELHDLETGATADMIVATPEVAGAWNMGVDLAQTAEKALASFLATAGSALVMEAIAGYGKNRGRCCPRLLGIFGAMNCDCCGEEIGKRQYHHDNFDLCQACYSKGSRCLSASHDMTLLQLATNQDLSPERPIVKLYSNWEPEAVEFITRSQLSGGEYTLFGFLTRPLKVLATNEYMQIVFIAATMTRVKDATKTVPAAGLQITSSRLLSAQSTAHLIGTGSATANGLRECVPKHNAVLATSWSPKVDTTTTIDVVV
ncbi:hypothetical protein CPAR01_13223 [Colletotrichum paranaense]|uniref:Uncharacterized protein n=1 Tax=Colletotrichum paranaense TaxID=1914294 RepID=A0ABQ9S5H5_9PEZI|nr:uncharacterized protein CPAR01_13223 [Colletotrichum paranaense]KAK1526695.1 hypothetical protein CPAR01_13223 [Colletotrichum paranaense]